MTLSEGHLLCWSMLIHKQFQFQGSHQLQEEIPQQELACFVCLFVCSFVCLFVCLFVCVCVKNKKTKNDKKNEEKLCETYFGNSRTSPVDHNVHTP